MILSLLNFDEINVSSDESNPKTEEESNQDIPINKESVHVHNSTQIQNYDAESDTENEIRRAKRNNYLTYKSQSATTAINIQLLHLMSHQFVML